MLYADIANEYKEQIISLTSSGNVSERLKDNIKFVVNYDWKSMGRHLETVLEDAI